MKLVVNNKFNSYFKDSSLISKPYLIAEIGVNHEGLLSKAMKLIKLAKKGGADAVKFQTYKADKIASKESPYYWDIKKEKTRSQHELFKKYDLLNKSDYIELSKYCIEMELEFLSTPFDDQAVDDIDPLVSYFKIASADITSIPLLKKIGQKNKPVLISVGASNLEEIKNAIFILNQSGCTDIGLLHCVLNYPTLNKDARLSKILSLKKFFPNYLIGYSDHTLPNKEMDTLKTASLLGAKVIEKHFTNDKNLPGNDHYHSMDYKDILNFTESYKKIYKLLGNNKLSEFDDLELISRKNARRSIVLSKEMLKDQVITEENITYKRPGTGIEVINWEKVLGKKIKNNLKKDHVLKWEDIYTDQ